MRHEDIVKKYKSACASLRPGQLGRLVAGLTPKEIVGCSSCGGVFETKRPDQWGYSHCEDHKGLFNHDT